MAYYSGLQKSADLLEIIYFNLYEWVHMSLSILPSSSSLSTQIAAGRGVERHTAAGDGGWRGTRGEEEGWDGLAKIEMKGYVV